MVFDCALLSIHPGIIRNGGNPSSKRLKMKKLLIFGLFMSCFAVVLEAQNPSQRAEVKQRVEQYRVKFFTEQLQLSDKESKDFWPLFNEYEAKKKALRGKYPRGAKPELLSDAELEDYVLDHLDREQKQLDLKKDFYRQIRGVLPIRKVAMIPRTEQQFKKEVLREIRQRRQNRGRADGMRRGR